VFFLSTTYSVCSAVRGGYFTYDELSRLPDMIGLERYQPRVDDMSKEEIMEEIEKIKDRMRQCQ